MKLLKTIVLTAALLGVASSGLADSITGKVTATGLRSNANAVVYIEKIDGETFDAPDEPLVIDQKGKVFVPKVAAVLAGTTVDFLNSDPFAHSVFTPDSCADEFNLGSWETGEARSHTFDEPCAAVLLCKAHPEMVAFVVAVETPYFAVTDSDGAYTIPDVPAGTYTLTVWHERFDRTSQDVTVDGDTAVDFTLER